MSGRPAAKRMNAMKTRKATLLLSALLYAQGLLGIAAVTAVLMRMPAEEPKLTPVATATISDVG
jgi:heme A synthase